MKKYREFWIDKDNENIEENEEIYFGSAFIKHPRQGVLNWYDDFIHVIEYSAYQSLKEQASQLEKALEKISNSPEWILEDKFNTHSKEPLKATYSMGSVDVARQALENYKKFKEKK